MKLRSACLAFIAAAVLFASPVERSRAQGEVPAVAVAEISFVDTSGEVVDQSADHSRRLREFAAALRSDLSASGKLRGIALDCSPNACSIGDMDADRLVEKAQAAGAVYLVISSFHKTSTLIQGEKFEIVDVKARSKVVDRLISFRGDNDEAYRRAEGFIVRQILEQGKL